MTYYVAQERTKRTGPGTFWTGKGWSSFENRKVYLSLDSATEDFAAATRSAVRSTLLMDTSNTIHAKTKIRQRV